MQTGKAGGGGTPMNKGGFASALVRLNHITHRIVLFIAQASILAMVAIVTLTVILRYCFKALDNLTDIVVLLCGLFMLISGGARTAKLFTLPGVLPITGISTAWQYLPIPVAGFVMSFDSVLFLTGIVSRDDLLYSEPEVDFTDEAAVAAMTKEAEKK